MLCYARAYFSFAYHRAIGVPYEILTIYDASPDRRLHFSWHWPPWQLHPGSITGPAQAVPVDPPHTAHVALRAVIWGNSTEEKVEQAGNQLFVDGVPSFMRDRAVTRTSELTFLGEKESEWIGSLQERWCAVEQKMVLSTVALNRSLTRVYGKENAWYIFSADTQVELEVQAHPQVAEAILRATHLPQGKLAVPPGTFLQALSPKSDSRIMTALDNLVAKASLWQRGEQSRVLLLQSLRQIDFRYAGMRTFHDNLIAVILWFTFFYLPTFPLHALFFFPLLVVPYWLAVPIALVYPLVMAAWWVSWWRRPAKLTRTWLPFLLVMHLMIYIVASPV
jgi:hypothetical protein